MTSLWHDARYGLRILARNRGFTAIAVLSLALGIGANAAVFSVANTLFFRRLPFGEPERLVAVWNETKAGERLPASWEDMDAWRRQSQSLQAVAGYWCNPDGVPTSLWGSDAQRVSLVEVDEGFFAILQVPPRLGRLFLPQECQWTGANSTSQGSVILGYDVWKKQFGGRSDVLGQVLVVDTGRRVVVGVMPPGFRLFRDNRPEVYVPVVMRTGDRFYNPASRFWSVIGRLKDGTRLEQARLELSGISQHLEKDRAETNREITARLEGLHEHLFGKRRTVSLLLLSTAGLVLLTGCANIANLLLARTCDREREIALRVALGASRSRITRQLLAESGLLAGAGGGLGLLLARWGVQVFNAFSTAADMGLPATQMDGVVIGYTLVLSLLTGLLFGMAPVLHCWRANLNASVKAGAGMSAFRPSAHRLSDFLVTGEVALSLVLLVGTGLLLRSLLCLSQVHPGFEADNVLTMSIGSALPDAQETDESREQREAAFWSQLLERIGALPGIRAAALSDAFPMSPGASLRDEVNARRPIKIEGRQLPAPGYLLAQYQDVSPDYFRVMGVPLIRGRFFEAQEGPAVVIINETFAREQWPGRDPVGQRILLHGDDPYTVVGVVGDVRQRGLRFTPPRRQIFQPLAYAVFPKCFAHYLMVRTQNGATAGANMIRDVVRSTEPERAVSLVRTMRQVMTSDTAWDRLNAAVVSLFGVLAVLLALVGLYGIVARTVAARTKEIGIRMALGARKTEVLAQVGRRGMVLVLVGLGIGLVGAFGLTRMLESLLYEVRPTDPMTFAVASLTLLGVALLACYIPARRAARVDPMVALRYE
jgi:putative ABC transport system permease protein